MTGAKSFADLNFQIECRTMMLYSPRDGLPVACGPGEIWQNAEGRLEFKIFIDGNAYGAILMAMFQPGITGQVIPDKDLLILRVQVFSLPVWESSRVLPVLSEGMGGGVVKGKLGDLIHTTEDVTNSDFCTVILRLKGNFKFPCNRGTEMLTSIGGQEYSRITTLNAAFFEMGSFKFKLFSENKHIVFALTLPASEMTSHIPSRMVEALQFVLGKQLTLLAVETSVDRKRITRLISSNHGSGTLMPPLRFHGSDKVDHIWRMFGNYFMTIRSHLSPDWHPISCQIGRVLASSMASIEVQVLTLSIAVEVLASKYFTNLVSPDPELLRDLDAVINMISDLKLTSRNRILGALNVLKKSRNSDIVRQFISHHSLDPGLFASWRKLRNSTAHGDADGYEAEKLFRLKDEVLFLLYSMVFAIIGYRGPRTNFSLLGWPICSWPV